MTGCTLIMPSQYQCTHVCFSVLEKVFENIITLIHTDWTDNLTDVLVHIIKEGHFVKPKTGQSSFYRNMITISNAQLACTHLSAYKAVRHPTLPYHTKSMCLCINNQLPKSVNMCLVGFRWKLLFVGNIAIKDSIFFESSAKTWKQIFTGKQVKPQPAGLSYTVQLWASNVY